MITTVVISGSGFNLGFHQGVVEVLDERVARPDYIVGTSGGALVGAMWAMGKLETMHAILEDVDAVSDWFEGNPVSRFLGGAESLYEMNTLRHLAREHIHTDDFQTPFFAAVVDDLWNEYHLVSHERSFIADAVVGSASVIPVVPRVRIEGSRTRWLLKDGGHLHPIGDLYRIVEMTRCEQLVVIDATFGEMRQGTSRGNSIIDNLFRTIDTYGHLAWLEDMEDFHQLTISNKQRIGPSYHLGPGMRVRPGEVAREIEHGRQQANAALSISWIDDLTA